MNCSTNREGADSRVLIFSYGTYRNWTNFELRQMNFKVDGDDILIDTTYNLVLSDFRPHLKERAADFPMIVNWLKKPTNELQRIQDQLNKLQCERLHTFKIQVENSVDVFEYEWASDCNRMDVGQLNSVLEELNLVKRKYQLR